MVIFLLFSASVCPVRAPFVLLWHAPATPHIFVCSPQFNCVPREFWSTLNAHPYYQWELGIVISSKLRT